MYKKIEEYKRYDAGNKTWNIEQILNRKKYLMSEIEKMLEIKREDIDLRIAEESSNGKTGKSKWLYKGVYYDNAKLVRALVHDYIVDNDIKSFWNIPEDIRNFKMYSHELIIDENNEMAKNYSYTKIESNGLEVYVRSICKRDNTKEFIRTLKNRYEFILETVEETNE